MNFVNLLVTNTVYYLEFGSILYFFVFFICPNWVRSPLYTAIDMY